MNFPDQPFNTSTHERFGELKARFIVLASNTDRYVEGLAARFFFPMLQREPKYRDMDVKRQRRIARNFAAAYIVQRQMQAEALSINCEVR